MGNVLYVLSCSSLVGEEHQQGRREIASGLNNKTPLGGNKYQGTMSDGTTLTIYLDDAGNVKSAFPEL